MTANNLLTIKLIRGKTTKSIFYYTDGENEETRLYRFIRRHGRKRRVGHDHRPGND